MNKKIIWLIATHIVAIIFFKLVFSYPSLHELIKNTSVRPTGSSGTPIGAVLIIVPALVVSIKWFGFDIKNKRLGEKILFSIFFILNVFLTLFYIFMMY